MKYSLLLLASTLIPMSSAFAQTGPASRPRPILEGEIVSRSRETRRVIRVGGETKAPSTASPTEERAFELMNAQRLSRGLSPLEWDEKLAEVARLHSMNMATLHFFNHRGQDGGMVDDRAAKFGVVNWLAIGENIAFMKGYSDPAATAVEKWMNSPSHKKNILGDQWRQSAIGVAVSDDGSVYFTQVFIER